MINEKISKNLNQVSNLLNDTRENFNKLFDEYKFALKVYENVVDEYFLAEDEEQAKNSARFNLEYFMGYKAGLQKAVEIVFGKEKQEGN